MWKECRLWIIDSLVSITLFLLVPILLSLTGLVTISVAPGAALIVLGYALYIFQCVFSRDMKRGIWALVDLMRNISVTHTFTVQEIQSCHSHFLCLVGFQNKRLRNISLSVVLTMQSTSLILLL